MITDKDQKSKFSKTDNRNMALAKNIYETIKQNRHTSLPSHLLTNGGTASITPRFRSLSTLFCSLVRLVSFFLQKSKTDAQSLLLLSIGRDE